MADKCKNSIVDYVDPRLKNINRPLAVAIPVIIINVAVFVALFFQQLRNCTTNTWVGEAQSMLEELTAIGPDCILHQAFLNARPVAFDGNGPFNTVAEGCHAGESDPPGQAGYNCNQQNNYMATIAFCYWPFEDEIPKCCTKHNYECEEIHSSYKGQKWCPGVAAVDEKIITDGGSYEGEPPNGAYVKADYNYRSEIAMKVNYKTCPDPTTIFGATMGWVAIVESVAIVFILMLGKCTGCIIVDFSYMKSFLSEAGTNLKTGAVDAGYVDAVANRAL